MKKFLITGGNSGIGLDAGRQLASLGHHVILLGRDPAKGAAAVESLKATPGKAEFHPVDLSTYAGVRKAADTLLAAHPVIDGMIQGAGVLTLKDLRTADDLNPVFAVNYLSRYHLGQLMLPALKKSPSPKMVILVAQVSLNTKVNFDVFPKFKPFPGMGALPGIQIANHHYIAHLAKAEPSISCAVVNVGLVATEIMRDMPTPMKIGFAILGPLVTVSVEKSASNPTKLSTTDGWQTSTYWPKPGNMQKFTPLAFDAAETAKVVAISKELTGV